MRIDAVRIVRGDLREPEHLLGHPDVRELIDFSQPVGLLMTAVVHFVPDESDPQALLARYVDALAPGSYLSLSHLTDDHKPPRAVQEFCRVFDHATEQMHFRSKPEVERFFTGLDLVSAQHGNTGDSSATPVTGARKTWRWPTAMARTGSTAGSPGAPDGDYGAVMAGAHAATSRMPIAASPRPARCTQRSRSPSTTLASSTVTPG